MKNNIFVALVLLNLISCTSNERVEENNLQTEITRSPLQSLDKLKFTIDSLIDVKEYLVAKIKLDSVILVNVDEPYFYFQRGVCQTQLIMHEEAISDFNKAISMDYKKDVCRSMIKFNELAISDN